VSDLLHRPHQDRPDPAVLLIDAVINRQSELAQRLSQQLVHRRGVAALEEFVGSTLQESCGVDGALWLRDQLGDGNAAAATAPTPTPQGVGSLIKEALDEAMAPLRRPSSGMASDVEEASQDPWAAKPVRAVAPAPTGDRPAPRPADLAEWRSWLGSDAA
jgi:hypothetical protein